MKDLLAGKAAFVTGGSAGIGFAIVEAFAAAGARGFSFDLAAPAKALPKGWSHRPGDVRDNDSIAAALAAISSQLGRLDVLVANAGVVPPWRESDAIDLEEWDEVFAVNVRGMMATIKHGIPLMKSAGGSIITMASVNAYAGHPRQSTYVASKHAVLGITRATAQDVGRFGIRVNAICPGAVATLALLERLRERAGQGGSTEKAALRRYSHTALGRIATAAEVAGAAVFLASDLSSGITGQSIVVDAGIS
jgi:NAD(P)-dependent dehydrogenase (short-subunit alcohol dehydrogenase family)